MSDPQDLAVALPTDTATFSAGGMLPVGKLDDCHALVLADDVREDEVEALALSQDEHAGWVGTSRLQLVPGADLVGPWPLDAELRGLIGLPDWATQIMLLECPPQRGGPMPEELAGLDPVADAFPRAQPEGRELIALTRLRAIARRLAGALVLKGDAGQTVVQPDPDASVDMEVLAPVWLTPDAAETLLAGTAPGIRCQLDAMPTTSANGLDSIDEAEMQRLVELIGADALDRAWRAAKERSEQEDAQAAQAAASGQTVETYLEGYALSAPVDPDQPTWGQIEVRVGGVEMLPVAVRGVPWAQAGAVYYALVWQPQDLADRDPARLSRVRRAERERAARLIEDLAEVISKATEGLVVDEDGFLIAF